MHYFTPLYEALPERSVEGKELGLFKITELSTAPARTFSRCCSFLWAKKKKHAAHLKALLAKGLAHGLAGDGA